MSLGNTTFKNALGRGDREALEQFYQMLVSARTDDQFWSELRRLIPPEAYSVHSPAVQVLRSEIQHCSFPTFLHTASSTALIAFLFLAMLQSSCGEPQPERLATEILQPEIQQAPPPATEHSPTPKPAPENALPQETPKQLQDTGTSPPLTLEESREELFRYITVAQLPTREKRRLKNILKNASDDKIINTQPELEKLFETETPKQIADILQAMVLFRAPPAQNKKRPKATGVGSLDPLSGIMYKGVDFS